ncbi:MAG: hypothetical protein KC496_18865 [Anaerolineae bacterium]|nr:hypothetical protein [Anaerolineae bacterium]
MTQISAAENHIIQVMDGRWRLLYQERPTAEATTSGLRYGNRFGSSRRLPGEKILQTEDIQQVVLGWQRTDEAWHLGLILKPPIAEERGSRWCEMVYWPDPEVHVFQELAQQTGEHLAQTLGVPFRLIPPRQIEATPQPRPLPELPLHFGLWTMEYASADKRRFVIKRSTRWEMRQYGRIAWYTFWMLVYLALSLMTLFSDLALPNAGTLLPDPHWLPYMGLATVVLLAGLIVATLITTLRKPNSIFVDGVRGTISAWKNRRLVWQIPANEIQSVYVSEIVKRREVPPATEYGEINLHLGGGKFHFVLVQEDPEENADTPLPDDPIQYKDSDVRELTQDNAFTDLQAANLYIAETLGILAAWHDLRVR